MNGLDWTARACAVRNRCVSRALWDSVSDDRALPASMSLLFFCRFDEHFSLHMCPLDFSWYLILSSLKFSEPTTNGAFLFVANFIQWVQNIRFFSESCLSQSLVFPSSPTSQLCLNNLHLFSSYSMSFFFFSSSCFRFFCGGVCLDQCFSSQMRP